MSFDPADLSEARARVVAIARSVVGLEAGDGKEGDAYADLVAPGETEERRREIDAGSGCGLVVRGVWRRAGIEHPILSRPYRRGKALEDVYVIAGDAGALKRGGFVAEDFAAGNVVHVRASATDVGHVFTVVDPQLVLGGDAVELVSVDGGQKENGRQAIEQIVRTIFPAKASDSRRTPPPITRSVVAVVDLDALWAALGVVGTLSS